MLNIDESQLLQLREKKENLIKDGGHGEIFDQKFKNMINQSPISQHKIAKELTERSNKILELSGFNSRIDADKFPHYFQAHIDQYSESCKSLSDKLRNRNELQEYPASFSKLNDSMQDYRFCIKEYRTNLSEAFRKFFKKWKEEIDDIVKGVDVEVLIALNENLKNQCIEWASLTWWKKLWRAFRG